MRLFTRFVTVTILTTLSLPLSAQDPSDFTVSGQGREEVYLPHPITEGTWDVRLIQNSENDPIFGFQLRGTRPSLPGFLLEEWKTENVLHACFWPWCHIIPEITLRSRIYVDPFLFQGRWSIRFTKRGANPPPDPPDPDPEPPTDGTCTPTTDVLHFDDYRVRMCYITGEGETGQAKAGVWSSSQSGILWFFDRENAEALVKVLDGCGHNGYRWVFVAPVTTLGFELRITAPSGETWTHTNQVNQTASAKSDTKAFRCN